jgi:hypothetical protein
MFDYDIYSDGLTLAKIMPDKLIQYVENIEGLELTFDDGIVKIYNKCISVPLHPEYGDYALAVARCIREIAEYQDVMLRDVIDKLVTITRQDFEDFTDKKLQLMEFLVKKCTEMEDVSIKESIDDYYKDEDFSEDYDKFNMRLDDIVVYFKHVEDDEVKNTYYRILPLDILFDDDFKEKIKARLLEEHERQKKLWDEAQREREKKNRAFEIDQLRQYMTRYSEEAKEIIKDL